MTPRALDLLERISTLLDQEARATALRHGLNSAQFAVVLYLSKANQYSNTPAAAAEYLGLTKGTVSQTLGVLERGGFLRKKADREDGRVVRLELTARGSRLIDTYLGNRADLTNAGPANAGIEKALEALLTAMQRARGGRTFGLCHTCRHFRSLAGGFECGLTGEPLSSEQIVRICREHEAA